MLAVAAAGAGGARPGGGLGNVSRVPPCVPGCIHRPRTQRCREAGGKRPGDALALLAAATCLGWAVGMAWHFSCAHRTFCPHASATLALPQRRPSADGASEPALWRALKHVRLVGGGPRASFISATSLTRLHTLRVY